MRTVLPLLFVIALCGSARSAEPDPIATQFLADARAARAVWENFPGFTADLIVNIDGKEFKGTLRVEDNGKVHLDGVEGAGAAWALPTLRSIVAHRLPLDLKVPTPCRFAAEDARHPLGRQVLVLNDELHSSYRIRDRQIIVVNRTMNEQRFTTTVLENRINANKKFLPASYVVNYWGTNGDLVKSDAHRQTWVRVGAFDLPVLAEVVTASKAATGTGLAVRSLTLSGHQLLSK